MNKFFSWEISRKLLLAIIEDKVSDAFVCELIWERLCYEKHEKSKSWIATLKTPKYWSDKYVEAPQIVAERSAAVHLTRSISKEYKQSLKEFMNFKGYKINELYPRRTRRAAAVNWLISYVRESNLIIPENGKLPELKNPPINPAVGHTGDLPII